MDNGYTGRFAKVEKIGHRYVATDHNGVDVTSDITTVTMSAAVRTKSALGEFKTKTARIQWRQTPMSQYLAAIVSTDVTSDEQSDEPVDIDGTVSHQDIVRFIHNSESLKPEDLMISAVRWKYLVRSAIRGSNIMVTGPSGSGKTHAVYSLAKALPSRPFYVFNLGATQDPRSALIGNTHFDGDSGTYFSPSAFVEAIQTPNAIVLCDELTRAHPDAWNILMSVFDPKQKYLRLDEDPNSPIVKVAEGVSFIATANIGVEYTATRVLDRALRDRFVVIEMDVLKFEDELSLLMLRYPGLTEDQLTPLAKVGDHTRNTQLMDDGKISTMVSTRTNLEAAGLLQDGFSLEEAANVAIFPLFDKDGGVDSERAYVIQYMQQFFSDDSPDKLF